MKTTLTLGNIDHQKKPSFLLIDKVLGNCVIFKKSYLNNKPHSASWIPSGVKAICLMQS